MTEEELRKEKDQLIKADIKSYENRARHVFNQGYELGYQQHGKDFVAKGEKAYRQGFEDGKQVGYNKGYEDGARSQDEVQYQHGFEAAWGMLKNICLGGRERLLRVFGTISITQIIVDNTAAEAKDKIDAWAQKKQQTDDLKVGDEVVDSWGYIFYVVDICDGDIRCWNKEGKSVLLVDGGLRKTGKHIDGIAEVLKQMQEG